MYQLSPEKTYPCRYCKGTCIKKGIRNTIQKYRCRGCGKYQQRHYSYSILDQGTKKDIAGLSKEGMGISSISRWLKKPKTTIQRALLKTGNTVVKPQGHEPGGEYELDEMTLTIAGQKDIYLIYAINRDNRQVVDFFIGNRTKDNIRRVVDSVMSSSPKKIYTDGLNSYPSLIPKNIHKLGRRLSNRIERKNLTLRNQVRRLSRNTLCFTRNIEMLNAVMKLVFWT